MGTASASRSLDKRLVMKGSDILNGRDRKSYETRTCGEGVVGGYVAVMWRFPRPRVVRHSVGEIPFPGAKAHVDERNHVSRTVRRAGISAGPPAGRGGRARARPP